MPERLQGAGRERELGGGAEDQEAPGRPPNPSQTAAAVAVRAKTVICWSRTWKVTLVNTWVGWLGSAAAQVVMRIRSRHVAPVAWANTSPAGGMSGNASGSPSGRLATLFMQRTWSRLAWTSRDICASAGKLRTKSQTAGVDGGVEVLPGDAVGGGLDGPHQVGAGEGQPGRGGGGLEQDLGVEVQGARSHGRGDGVEGLGHDPGEDGERVTHS